MKVKSVTLWKIATFVLAALLVVSFILPRGTKDGVQTEPTIGLTIVNDPSCKACDVSQIITALKAEVFPNLNVKEVTYNSKEGKALITEFKINMVPVFIFDSKIEKSSKFAQISPALQKTGDQYMLSSQALGGGGKLLGEVKTNAADPVKGKADAKITIVEFTDFQCPYCGKFTSETLPKINEEYIKTGKAKIVFKDLPLPFHNNAINAHMAAKCAGDQDKFWQYHDKLFANQDKLAVEDLKGYAEELGLDAGKFSSCLDSKKYEKEVTANAQYGNSLGISGTPSFIVNGMIMVGAQPFEEFKKVIDAELS